jgi:predicted nucleic acid-binding protein
VIYLDTGCLLKLYFPEPETPRVIALVRGQPLAYLGLHEVELRNGLALKRFRKEATAGQLRAVQSLVDADVRSGVLHRAAIVWEDVFRASLALAATHTSAFGCRTLDILHCAAASALGTSSFVTTDARQRRLAQRIGLVCPPV